MPLATFKHISSKNADYGAAEKYLTFKHDEFTMKPTLDEHGRLIPREEFRIATLNCGGEDFAVACMRANLKFNKNRKREDVKSHHYIISFDPRDGTENGLTVDKAQALCEEFCKKHFPGHQAIVCTHPDGHNESGNIHVHIVINSLRIADVPMLPHMDRPADRKAGCKHRCTEAAMNYLKAEVMEMCHRENLFQIDLLHGSRERITEREYWAQKRGQLTLDEENKILTGEGKPVKETKFETDKARLRTSIKEALSSSTSFEEFAGALLQMGITVKESRGRLSYLTPDRTKPITARKLGDAYEKAAVLEAIEQNIADIDLGTTGSVLESLALARKKVDARQAQRKMEKDARKQRRGKGFMEQRQMVSGEDFSEQRQTMSGKDFSEERHVTEKKDWSQNQGQQKKTTSTPTPSAGDALHTWFVRERKSADQVWGKERELQYVIDIEQKRAEGKQAGYIRWAQGFNFRLAMESNVYCKRAGIQNMDELAEAIAKISSRVQASQERLHALEAALAEKKALQHQLLNYIGTRDVRQELKTIKSAKERAAFKKQHAEAFAQVEEATRYFKEHGIEKLPSYKNLQKEIQQLVEQKNEIYTEHRQLKKEEKQLKIAEHNLETHFGWKASTKENPKKEQDYVL